MKGGNLWDDGGDLVKGGHLWDGGGDLVKTIIRGRTRVSRYWGDGLEVSPKWRHEDRRGSLVKGVREVTGTASLKRYSEGVLT